MNLSISGRAGVTPAAGFPSLLFFIGTAHPCHFFHKKVWNMKKSKIPQILLCNPSASSKGARRFSLPFFQQPGRWRKAPAVFPSRIYRKFIPCVLASAEDFAPARVPLLQKGKPQSVLSIESEWIDANASARPGDFPNRSAPPLAAASRRLFRLRRAAVPAFPPGLFRPHPC